MFCEHCGSQIFEESRFCPHCGRSLSGEESEENKDPINKPKITPKRRKWWLWIVWILMIGFLALYWIGNSIMLPEEMILRQLNSLKEGKLTEAYYEYTSKGFQKTVSLDDFKKYVRTNNSLLKGKSFLVEDVAEEGPLTTVRGYIIDEDGASFEVVYKLVFEEDAWKILSFSPIVRTEKEEVPHATLTKQILEPVKQFMDHLNEPEFDSIYTQIVSKDFLDKTSHSQFQKFVSENKALGAFHDYEISEHQLNKGVGEVFVLLNPQEEAVPLAFTLIKENDTWKIFRVSLGLPKQEEALKTKELFEIALFSIVKDNLELLKNEKLEQFYHEMTAATFRNDVDFPLLVEFHKGFPFLSQYDRLSMIDYGVDNDLAWIDVGLHHGQSSHTLEFTLGNENGEWKVTGLRIND